VGPKPVISLIAEVGGLNITAKVGLNLMGNALSGNFYQSASQTAKLVI
jgi:hypothetical protein